MDFQSFEMPNPGPQQRLGRSSYEERTEIQQDTVSIEESKSILEAEQETNMNAGKRRIIKKQRRNRAEQERGERKRTWRLKENNNRTTS